MKTISLPTIAWLVAVIPMVAFGQSGSRFYECREEAEDVSGYHGQEAPGFVAGSIRGGMGGAALSAAGGWITGSNAKKAAKRGAAVGALIGGVRAAARKKDVDEKRELYDRILERCMARDSG